MKQFGKLLALIVALCMVLSIGVMASGEPSGEASGDPSGEASDSIGGAYTDGVNILYIAEDGSFVMTKTGQNMEGEDFELTIQGVVDDDGEFTITGLFDGDINLIEMATEEQLAEDLASVKAAFAGGLMAEASVEDAFIEYIHEWLLDELEVNANMTIEQVEDEFMPLVEQMDFLTFPAEMIYSGMLEQGVPMTFEEFAAQYQPASGEPSGETSGEASVEDAFIEYIHEWLLDELEVNANMTIEQVEDEFMPLVEKMDFLTFPAEMIYSGMLEQGVPMTFEEFAAQY